MTSWTLTYPPKEYSSLTIAGGGFAEFGELFARLRRRWVKVEFLQYYDESGSLAFDAFLNGDFEVAAQTVARDVKEQNVYDVARENGVSMVRVRVYRVPLSDYLSKFEYFAYIADEEMGEQVFTVNWESVEGLIRNTGVSDFLIFDDWGVVALLYNESTGQVREARLVSDPSEIRAYSALAEKLIDTGEPFKEGEFAAIVEGRMA